MAYTAKFLDNQVVGVDDFNNIIADLCGDGVIPSDDGYNFETGVPYTMQKLNDMTKDAVYSAGVVPSSESALQVSFDSDSGAATINVGAAVFSSGLIFKVTETESVAFDSSKEQYIFLKHDTTANAATIEVYDEIPSETSTRFIVPLAKWIDGEASDLRTYAVGKLKCCANWNGTTKADFTYASGTESQTYTYRDVTVWDKGDEVNFIVFVAWDNSSKTVVHSLAIVTETDGEFSILCIVNKDNADVRTSYVDLHEYVSLYDFAHEGGGITATLKVFGTTYNSTQYPVEMYVSVVG